MGFVAPVVWPEAPTKAGLEQFGCSADPIQPSGPLEPSIPRFGTVLSWSFVDANP